jgi:hypothetical protein
MLDLHRIEHATVGIDADEKGMLALESEKFVFGRRIHLVLASAISLQDNEGEQPSNLVDASPGILAQIASVRKLFPSSGLDSQGTWRAAKDAAWPYCSARAELPSVGAA